MSLQGVLAGESLSTGLAEERFVAGVCIPVAFEVVLTIKG